MSGHVWAVHFSRVHPVAVRRHVSDDADERVSGVPVLTLEPTPVTVLAGTSVTLHCAAAGDPEPVISWRRREQPSGADEGAPLETELVSRQNQSAVWFGSLGSKPCSLSMLACFALATRGVASGAMFALRKGRRRACGFVQERDA